MVKSYSLHPELSSKLFYLEIIKSRKTPSEMRLVVVEKFNSVVIERRVKLRMFIEF